MADKKAAAGQGGILMELARADARLAMEAVMALAESGGPEAKAQAMLAGAAIARGEHGGGAPTRSAAMLSFMAKMLGGPEQDAMSFARAAGEAIAKRAPDLARLLSAERCLEIEGELPGFASGLRADALWRAPRLAGLMRAKGMIGDKKAFDASCRAGAARYQIDKFPHHRPAPPTSAAAREDDLWRLDAKAFASEALEADPGWAKAVCAEYWKLPGVDAGDGAPAQLGACLACLDLPASPLDGLGCPSSLGAKAKGLLAGWMAKVGHAGSEASARAAGAYLGELPHGEIALALGSRRGSIPSLPVMGGISDRAFEPINASALALTCVEEPQRRQGNEWDDWHAKAWAKRWASFAEALAQSGAAPPKFKAKEGLGPYAAGGEVCCVAALAGAMLQVGFSLGPKAHAWFAEGSEPGEAARMAGFIRHVADKGGRGGPRSPSAEVQGALAALEGFEIALGCDAPAAGGVGRKPPRI